MTKSELVSFVRQQVGIELVNDKTNKLNSMRKVLYTNINRIDFQKIAPLLYRKGIRVENHIKDCYFIHIV